MLTVAATALALATISDAFVYLTLQRSLDFDARFLPLLYVATAASYMLLAVPQDWGASVPGGSRSC